MKEWVDPDPAPCASKGLETSERRPRCILSILKSIFEINAFLRLLHHHAPSYTLLFSLKLYWRLVEKPERVEGTDLDSHEL